MTLVTRTELAKARLSRAKTKSGPRPYTAVPQDRGRWDTYFVGHTVADRFGNRIPIAQYFWDLYEAGKVYLFQKRIGDGRFEYRAMWR